MEGLGGLATTWQEFEYGFGFLRTQPLYKLNRMFFGLVSYAYWLDALTALTLALPVLASLALGRLRVHAGMLLTVLGLLACYFVCPSHVAGAYFVDDRFAIMAPLALAAALRPDLPAVAMRIAAPALLAVSLLRTGVIGWVWDERQQDVASVARALSSVPPGVAVLPLEHRHDKSAAPGPFGRHNDLASFSSYAHLATLALPWRHDFVPTEFASRGQQPLQVLPPWDEIADPAGGVVASVHALDMPAVFDDEVPYAPYLKNWRDRFSYAVVVNADTPDRYGAFVPPSGMELVTDQGFAQLYRIGRPTAQAANQ